MLCLYQESLIARDKNKVQLKSSLP